MTVLKVRISERPVRRDLICLIGKAPARLKKRRRREVIM
jgi:hypothetical protein